MKYELVKKLKDAGFPMFMTDHENCDYQQVEIFEGVAYHVPNLSELIDACGDRFEKLTKFGNRFFAVGEKKAGYSEITYYAIPEEAVANLWLVLNKKAS